MFMACTYQGNMFKKREILNISHQLFTPALRLVFFMGVYGVVGGFAPPARLMLCGAAFLACCIGIAVKEA